MVRFRILYAGFREWMLVRHIGAASKGVPAVRGLVCG